MTDRPIIFSAPTVRALLDGRKSQTRRVLKEQRHIATPSLAGGRWQWIGYSGAILGDIRTPYAPGDRLWVREAFVRYHELDECDMRVGPLKIAYRADGGFRWLDADTDEFCDTPPWKPSIHMPRWASRLTLLVTEVRVQQLQEISDDDARAEGVLPDGFEGYRGHEGTIGYPTAIWAFRHIWNSINGPDAWDANPWVAAISFTVHRCNIDTMEEGTW